MCYDFGGQEVFYPTHEFFLSSRAVYLLVVNASNLNFKSLSYWLAKVNSYAGKRKPPVIIVGTNTDKMHVGQLASLHEQIKSHSNHLVVAIAFVSCLTREGIKELRKEIFDQVETSEMFASVPLLYSDCLVRIQRLSCYNTDAFCSVPVSLIRKMQENAGETHQTP